YFHYHIAYPNTNSKWIGQGQRLITPGKFVAGGPLARRNPRACLEKQKKRKDTHFSIITLDKGIKRPYNWLSIRANVTNWSPSKGKNSLEDGTFALERFTGRVEAHRAGEDSPLFGRRFRIDAIREGKADEDSTT